MNSSLRSLCFITLTVACGIANAAFTQNTYLSFSGSIIEPDNSRNIEDQSIGWRIGLTKSINSRLLLEFQVSGNDYDEDPNEFSQYSAGVDANILFLNNERLHPFFIAGAGLQRSDSNLAGSETQNAYVDLGIGVFHQLKPNGLSMKFDMRARRDFYDDPNPGETDYDDFIVNVGLSFPIGKPSNEPQFEPAESNDEDNDGVNNTNDYCPNTEANAAVDVNGCSKKQLGLTTIVDSDEDGVADDSDNCPNTAKNQVADIYGCSREQYSAIEPAPEPVTAAPPVLEIPAQRTITFHAGTAQADSAGKETMSQIAKELVNREYVRGEIVGGGGNSESLNKARAQTVYKYMQRFGVPNSRISIKSVDAWAAQTVVHFQAR